MTQSSLFCTGSSDTADGLMGYQVITEESLVSESHEKSPTQNHELEDVKPVVATGDDLDTGQHDLDTGQNELQTVDASHDVIIPGMSGL